MKRIFGVIILLIIIIVSCTDATISNVTSLGSEAHIRCYSGGRLIFEGDSTGKLQTVSNSDGWQFKNKQTGKFIRISGDCVIEN